MKTEEEWKKRAEELVDERAKMDISEWRGYWVKQAIRLGREMADDRAFDRVFEILDLIEVEHTSAALKIRERFFRNLPMSREQVLEEALRKLWDGPDNSHPWSDYQVRDIAKEALDWKP